MKLNLYKAAARIFMAALFVCLLMPGAQAKEKYKATFIYRKNTKLRLFISRWTTGRLLTPTLLPTWKRQAMKY